MMPCSEGRTDVVESRNCEPEPFQPRPHRPPIVFKPWPRVVAPPRLRLLRVRLSTDVLRLLLLMPVVVGLLLLLVALLLFERRRAAALGHWQPRVPLCVCH